MGEAFREFIREKIENPVDTIVMTGANSSDVVEGMETGIAALRDAYNRHPAEGLLARPCDGSPGADDDKLQSGGA
jgi:hypothetical protein